jgi:hypothetical protein
MQYKLIENYHVENAIFGKDSNLGVTSFFFHVFTQYSSYYNTLLLYKQTCVRWKSIPQ